MQYLQVLATWFVMQVQVVSPRQVALISDCSLFSRKKYGLAKTCVVVEEAATTESTNQRCSDLYVYLLV